MRTLIMITGLMALMACGGAASSGRPRANPPAGAATRQIVIAPGRAQARRVLDPIAVVPKYPIPNPALWPGRIVNGVRFHYVPVRQ